MSQINLKLLSRFCAAADGQKTQATPALTPPSGGGMKP